MQNTMKMKQFPLFLFLACLCVQNWLSVSVHGLAFNGKSVEFSGATLEQILHRHYPSNQTGNGTRRLTEDLLGDTLLIVKRNFTHIIEEVMTKNWEEQPNKGGKPRPLRADYRRHTTQKRGFYRDSEKRHHYRRFMKEHDYQMVSRIDKDTVLVKASSYVNQPGDTIAVFSTEYKSFPGVTFPVTVKVVAGYILGDGIRVGPDLWKLKKPTVLWPTVETLASNPNVITFDTDHPLKLFSRGARNSMMNYSHNLPDGDDEIIGFPDTGFDLSHCGFDDPESTYVTGSQSVIPGSHPKIAAYVTAIPGVTDYRGSDGSHGTATACQGICYDCGIVVGMATKARGTFYDITPQGSDSIIRLPLVDGPGIRTFWEWLVEIFTIGRADVVSISWGADTGGYYSLMESELDGVLFDLPEKNAFIASGNWFASSPGLSKNGVSSGAVFGTNTKRVPDFSYYPPLPESGRIVPIMYAPGVFEELAYGYYEPDIHHNHHFNEDGSSFAPPTLAGLQAKYRQSYRMRHNGQKPLGALCTAVFLAASVPVDSVYTSGTSPPMKLYDLDPDRTYGMPVISFIPMEESYTFDWENEELPEKAYCYRVTETSQDAIRIAMAFYDYKSLANSNVNLVNNMDMRVFINHEQVYHGQDTLHTHERYTIHGGVVKDTTIRVVVYENDYTFYRRIPMGLSLHSTRLQRLDTCGTCDAMDTESCLTGKKYCNSTLGVMSKCLPSSNVAITDVHGVTCGTERFSGILVNGLCVPTVCNDGYYFDTTTSSCKCVLGFRKSSQYVCAEGDQYVELFVNEEGDNEDSTPAPSAGNRTGLAPVSWNTLLVVAVTMYVCFY